MDKTLLEPEKDAKFEAGESKKYKVKAIIDNIVYGQQTNSDQMPGLYYLIS